jgi:uncharacterized membrane protein YfcA
MEFSAQILLLLFAVAALAGCIDAIAGGGGLLVIPTLLALGMPPATALATNKLQSSGGSLTAAMFFVRRGIVDLRRMRWLIAMTFVGSLLGGWLLLRIDPAHLRLLVPVLLIGVALYVAFVPSLGASDRAPRWSLPLFACAVALPLGFYDGFFGPGVGTLLAVAFASLLGFNLVKATGHAKVLNFASNLAALLYFIAFGEIAWIAGLAMLVGQILGASLGARLVLRKGQRLIRRVMVVVCFALSCKLVISAVSG